MTPSVRGSRVTPASRGADARLHPRLATSLPLSTVVPGLGIPSAVSTVLFSICFFHGLYSFFSSPPLWRFRFPLSFSSALSLWGFFPSLSLSSFVSCALGDRLSFWFVPPPSPLAFTLSPGLLSLWLLSRPVPPCSLALSSPSPLFPSLASSSVLSALLPSAFLGVVLLTLSGRSGTSHWPLLLSGSSSSPTLLAHSLVSSFLLCSLLFLLCSIPSSTGK